MIRGAIDNVQLLNDGKVQVSGWTIFSEGTSHRAADVILVGRNDYAVTVIARLDIKEAANCGYNLIMASVDDLAALYWGGISLQARAGNETVNLRLWDRLEDKVLEIIASHLIVRLEVGDSEAFRAATKAANDRQDALNYLREAAANPVYENVLLQVGSTSNDNEVVIGREGFLFLLGGSNGVIQQYTNQAVHKEAASWVSTIRLRSDYCTSRGISFCQMIVPEKQSVIPEYFPGTLNVPTPLLAEISENLSDAVFYADCRKALRDLFVSGGSHPFRKVDSHLSYFGAECLVREIVRHFAIQGDIFAQNLRPVLLLGDLSEKFLKGGIAEQMLVPDFAEWEFARLEPTLKVSRTPPEGHGGTVLEWEAQRPLANKKLLVFGNSMFERGASPLGLSWWASRIFARMRFVWSNGLLNEQVQEFQPDLMICQTVERFLPTLPNT